MSARINIDIEAVAAELRSLRQALLELAKRVPESKAYRATARPGWTLKHELAALAAADDELLHVLDELGRRAAPFDLDLRRRRAEAMHRLQQLRLTPLVEQLERSGGRVAESLAAQGHLLTEPVRLLERDGRGAAGRAERAAHELVAAYRERSSRVVAALHAALEG